MGLLSRLPVCTRRSQVLRLLHRRLSCPGTVAADARGEQQASGSAETGDGAASSLCSAAGSDRARGKKEETGMAGERVARGVGRGTYGERARLRPVLL